MAKTELEKDLRQVLKDYYSCKLSGPNETNEYYWVAQFQKTIKQHRDAKKANIKKLKKEARRPSSDKN